ncbi:involucrin-like isoform X6 [Xiphophorus hellerii]|uniref:involucrin-like isoform X6 n=1 Tax=Xiphophorus hellerii TaxID=8084 RepID=UPI0013B35A89|nr:involucrin-like isoform X6 [Xiphophorus hellerii]
MSSVQPKRKWINEQLTPAEETEFKEILDNQRRLLDFSRLPLIILHRIDLPQCCVCKKEEVVTELSNQDGDFTLDQEKTEPLVIKIEQDEPEHLEIKHEQEEPEHLEIKHEQEEPEHLEIKHEQEEPEHLEIKHEQEEPEHLEIKHEQEEPEHLEIKHEQEEPEHLEIKHEQEEPEHLEIKHEQEEPEHLEIKLFKVEENKPFSSQDEEQLVLKQETGDILCFLPPTPPAMALTLPGGNHWIKKRLQIA